MNSPRQPQQHSRPRVKTPRFFLVLGAAFCSTLALQPLLAQASEEQAPATPLTPDMVSTPAEKAPTARMPAVGMKIYLDPTTGALVGEPPAGQQPLELTPEQSNAFSTSHEGLVATPSPVPGGGYSIHLQGRFQSPMVATVDASGRVRVEHTGGISPHHGHAAPALSQEDDGHAH
jgi:hypothetical protein